MKSAQGIFPIIPDDDTAFAFVEFLHSKGSAILLDRMGPGAPQIYVSLIEGARSHIVKTGSTTGIFRPDALSAAPGKAKYFFPGFTIRFIRDHQFTNSAGVVETLMIGDYQGQFHWHDGQGRLTIDASSYPLTADGSRHPHFSAEFAYYSLPIILTPVIQEWVSSRTSCPLPLQAPSPLQQPVHELASAEFLRIPAANDLAPDTHSTFPSLSQPALSQHYIPPPGPHFLAAENRVHQHTSRLHSMGPTPFSTPPTPRKVLFQDSPQSETQKSHSAAFGHSPGPSPSWEHTPQSQQTVPLHQGEDPVSASTSAPHGHPAATIHANLGAPFIQSFSANSAIPSAKSAPAVTVTALPPTTSQLHTQEQSAPFPTLQDHSRRPVMTSSRKRAAVGTLSPQIRPLPSLPSQPQSSGSQAPLASPLDQAWETRFQEAVRQAVLALNPLGSLSVSPATSTLQQPPSTLSAIELAEAEAAHAAQGKRLREAREIQQALAEATAMKLAQDAARAEAERAIQAAEESKKLQAHLQAQLQQLAAADAAAAQAFADRRAQMTRESIEITQRLQALQRLPQAFQPPYPSLSQPDRSILPPHLIQHMPTTGVTSTNSQPQQGSSAPLMPATGPAEPLFPAQVSSVPAQTAPQIGAPRPEEARQE